MDGVHRVVVAIGRGVAVAAALALAGCTMCPDPFDYAGPVPNGSAPQNEFRARSNGILPIGATPRPWPPIVKRQGPGDVLPASLVQAPQKPSVDAMNHDGVSSSVLTVEGDGTGDERTEPAGLEQPLRDPWEVMPVFETFDEADQSSVPEIDGATPIADPMPTLAETPGWRPRTTR